MNSIPELEKNLASTVSEPERMDILLQIVHQLRNNNPDAAEKYSNELLALAEKNGNIFFKAGALRYLGGVAEMRADYPLAIRYYMEAKDIYTELRLPSDLIFCNNQLGKVYANLGEYSKAIDFFEKALRLSVELGDKSAESNTLNAFSVLYQRSGNSEKAEELAMKSYRLAVETGNRRLQAIAKINLGNACGKREEWEKAISAWEESLAICKELNEEQLVASAMGNLGIAYTRLGKLKEAKENIEACLEVKKSINDVYDIARSIHNLGTIYWKMGDAEKAKELYNQALGMGEKSKAKSVHAMIYNDYVKLLHDTGDYKAAYEMLEKYQQLEKELFTEDLNVKTRTLEIRFDVERMEKENEIYRLKNIDLAEANKLITAQKGLIEQKNKDITDSILYAKRIQEAVLPSDERLRSWFGEIFVLYLPKDIVSGDFYWASEKDGKFILAVADSTGHGVPGAIMSIMGSSFLSEIIGTQGETDPGKILHELRKKVITALHQAGGDNENRDGMDIALCCFDASKKEMIAACANNPVWLIRNNEVDEAEADKFPVGIFPGELRAFTNHDTNLLPGDVLYLFTDGFADQFGGPRGKKFGYKQLRELLLANHRLQMEEQKKNILTAFENWRGDGEQIDDVLLVGLRIT
jgi:serine phosphatase RsbU (regulator of sigma subunit)